LWFLFAREKFAVSFSRLTFRNKDYADGFAAFVKGGWCRRRCGKQNVTQSASAALDCFVALLLAMTTEPAQTLISVIASAAKQSRATSTGLD
jgi:hypothetical protein